MSEKIFDPNEEARDERLSERVELANGVVYVKSMEVSDLLFCQEHSTRTGGPLGGSIDFSSMQLWQVVVSCYRGPETEARRVFDITHMNRIKKLSRTDWFKLRDAIDKVNGLSDEEADAMRDFTGAAPADSPAGSPPGPSITSAASPASSPSPASR